MNFSGARVISRNFQGNGSKLNLTQFWKRIESKTDKKQSRNASFSTKQDIELKYVTGFMVKIELNSYCSSNWELNKITFASAQHIQFEKKKAFSARLENQGQQNVLLKCYSLLFINSMFFQNAPKNESVPNEQNGISKTQNNAYSIVNVFPSIRILMLIQMYNWWILCASSGRINLDWFHQIKCLSRAVKNRYTACFFFPQKRFV